MIAEISTVRGRLPPIPRDPKRALGLGGMQWKCKTCGANFRFQQISMLYVNRISWSTLLMTFSLDEPQPQHALIHTCGEDVKARPLWDRPEWS